jgi:hypothetical protein
MFDAIIAVEHLAKSYLVGHKSVGLRPGDTFRDLVIREARNLSRGAINVIPGRKIVSGA